MKIDAIKMVARGMQLSHIPYSDTNEFSSMQYTGSSRALNVLVASRDQVLSGTILDSFCKQSDWLYKLKHCCCICFSISNHQCLRPQEPEPIVPRCMHTRVHTLMHGALQPEDCAKEPPRQPTHLPLRTFQTLKGLLPL